MIHMKTIFYIIVGIAFLGVIVMKLFAKGNAPSINPDEAYNRMKEDKSIVLLDVRSPEEYREARIPGALLIPVHELRCRAEKELADKSATIYIYCRSGIRAGNAAGILRSLGYQNVFNLGGIINWPYETVSG